MATFTRAAKNAALDQHNAAVLAQFARETGEHLSKPTAGATPAGDELKLRGIPAIGRGVAGVIRGTNPGRLQETTVTSADVRTHR